MKKLIALALSAALLLFCALPAAAAGEPESYGAYKHVFIIGVDGAGGFFGKTDTPNFDRIFGNGSVTYTARAETVTISAQNWGAILTGVSYSRHAITNDMAASKERGGALEYPTVFSLARRAFPDAELASFVNWDPINFGIIENDVGVTKEHRDTDEAVTDAICDYFNAGNAPAVFFVQLDSVDGAGHGYGCESAEYLSQIGVVDGLVGRIYDAIDANGLMEDGLFILVADHGHTPQGGHGGLSVTESEVTLAVAGKTVVNGGMPDADTRNRDVAAITLYALGIDRPAYMSARVPADLFRGVEGEKRAMANEPLEAFSDKLPLLVPANMPDLGLPLYITALACAAAVLLLALAACLFAVKKKRAACGLTALLCTLIAAVTGIYASKLFIEWTNLPLYACVDAVLLLSVAGVCFTAAYAKNGFALPKGKKAVFTGIAALFFAAAPYEIVVLVINTLIHHGQRPTFSITLSAFVLMAVLAGALAVIIAQLKKKPAKEN